MNVPLPPPPPPPIIPIPPSGENILLCYEEKQISLQDFQNILIQNCNIEGNGFAIYTKFLLQSFLQKGPVCGIVSLATAIKLIGETAVTPEELLKKAIANNFSANGEMFSVTNMAKLASEFLNAEVVQLDSPEDHRLFDFVNEGNVVLIAYDADKNHSPCLKKGHKAHWAIIYGVGTRSQNPESVDRNIISDDTPVEKLNCSEMYVVGGQGKSLKPSLWKLKDLLNSNANLVESNIEPNIALKEMFIVLSKQ